MKQWKVNSALWIAAVCFCLVMATCFGTAGMFARYSVSDSAGDSAQVAEFSVSVGNVYEVEVPFFDMYPGSSKEWEFSIVSSSEVSVACDVRVTTTGNLPLTFTVDGCDVTGQGATVGTLAPGADQKITCKLCAVWPESENDAAYAGEVDAIKLMIVARQVD